jgi:hypothetical protein
MTIPLPPNVKFTRPRRLQDLERALSLLPPRIGCNEGITSHGLDGDGPEPVANR